MAFLSREVPRWSRENHCYSCHNNGDAARALYEAARAGYRVPDKALADTTGWLSQPSGWDHNGGDGPFSDKRLARWSSRPRWPPRADRADPRSRGAAAGGRAAGASTRPRTAPGPSTGRRRRARRRPRRALATFLARDSLATAQPDRFRAAIDRADGWLMKRELVYHHGCLGQPDGVAAPRRAGGVRAPATGARLTPSRPGRRRRLGALCHLTARAVRHRAGLARAGEIRRLDQVRRMIARGRAYLIAHQHDDGSWTETTRPPGAESYAQRISTTGWATLALLATRDVPSATAGRNGGSDRNEN